MKPDLPPSDTGPHKIAAKDVAATTALGSAARLGTVLHKRQAAGTGEATVGKAKKRSTEASSLKTALLVVALTVGTLIVMIVFGK